MVASDIFFDPHNNTPSFMEWERIPKERLNEHVKFYNSVRREQAAKHWAFDMMVAALQSYYQRSGGLVPRNIGDLDLFWKTGNIPTRNLHLLTPKQYSQLQTHSVTQFATRCALCCQNFSQQDQYYELPCGHRFHVTHDHKSNTDELKCHLRSNNDCPNCGTQVHLSEHT